MYSYIRVFAHSEQIPELSAICSYLKGKGFDFATAPGIGHPEFENRNWQKMLLQYDPNFSPIVLERTATKELTEKIAEFKEMVEYRGTGEGKSFVLEILNSARQIYAISIPGFDLTEQGMEVEEALVEYLRTETSGYIQADYEGFFDDQGKLVLPFN